MKSFSMECTCRLRRRVGTAFRISCIRGIPQLSFSGRPDPGLHFFRESPRDAIPEPDHELLWSLEAEGVPTIHNMILGDRVLSALEYREALGYATFLARRLAELFDKLKPSVVIGGFDGIHAGIALAVAKRAGVPWYALNFSVIPPGLACFCDGMTPAARVQLPAVMRCRRIAGLCGGVPDAL